MAENVSLSAKQLRAVESLMTGATVTDAAKAAGVSPRQVHRWLNDATFTRALDEAKQQAVRHATRKLAGALDAATTSVVYLAQSAEDESVRLRAAVAVAVPTMLHELSEHGDFDERLSRLEAASEPK